MFGILSLFFFCAATAGFLYCLFRLPRTSPQRLWGIRACHLLGFLGVVFLRLAMGRFSDHALLIISSLVVSLVASELSQRYLEQE